ncbi:MAG TPA: HAMP domain-containing sensor histidine kinase [Candidatus Binatia bacterium]
MRARRNTLAASGRIALLLAATAGATSLLAGSEHGPSTSFVIQCFALGGVALAALHVRQLRHAIPGLSLGVAALLTVMIAFEMLRSGSAAIPLLAAGATVVVTLLATQLASARSRVTVVSVALVTLLVAASFSDVHGAELVQLGGALVFAAGIAFAVATGIDAGRARRERREVAHRRAAARERRAMAAREDMVANLSHDVRNPLAIAIGFAEMAADADLPADERAQALAGVRRSLWEISQLVENVLDGSADRAGALEPLREVVPLDGLCRDVLASTQVLLRGRPIALVGAVEPGLTVIADRHRLSRVLGNLLGNACKYTEHGEIRLEAHRRGDFAVLRVSDTGPGIPPADLPHIFDRFRRAHECTRGGVGLGLAIAYRLAERMGGALEVESTVGVGTTFSLVLPLAASAERTPAAA